MEWRSDVENMPKDGTHILIWCPVEKVTSSVFWIAQKDSERGGAWYGTDPMHRLNWIQHPSNWMPMPEPPTPSAPSH